MNIVAMVTLYFPGKEVVSNVRNISRKASLVILLDNTPNKNNSHIFDDIDNIKYIQNGTNLGLSVSFNKGLSLDVAKESDFIVFFDQDSKIQEDTVSILIHEYLEIQRKYKIGCIGPEYFETNQKKIIIPKSKKCIGEQKYSVSCVITSAMLTTYEVLKDIGFWNTDIFLDLSDWDLCWRLKERNYIVCLTSNTRLIHTLGKANKKIFFLNLREGSPVREYYQIRDSLKLFCKKYTPIKYKVRFILMWTIMPILYLLFMPKRERRARCILFGFIDGIKRKSGEYNMIQ